MELGARNCVNNRRSKEKHIRHSRHRLKSYRMEPTLFVLPHFAHPLSSGDMADATKELCLCIQLTHACKPAQLKGRLPVSLLRSGKHLHEAHEPVPPASNLATAQRNIATNMLDQIQLQKREFRKTSSLTMLIIILDSDVGIFFTCIFYPLYS